MWGTADSAENIVWGTLAGGENIVWGTDCGGNNCTNVVWGTVGSRDGENIVWGTTTRSRTSCGAPRPRREHRVGHRRCAREHRLGHRERREHRLGHVLQYEDDVTWASNGDEDTPLYDDPDALPVLIDSHEFDEVLELPLSTEPLPLGGCSNGKDAFP